MDRICSNCEFWRPWSEAKAEDDGQPVLGECWKRNKKPLSNRRATCEFHRFEKEPSKYRGTDLLRIMVKHPYFQLARPDMLILAEQLPHLFEGLSTDDAITKAYNIVVEQRRFGQSIHDRQSGSKALEREKKFAQKRAAREKA